MLSIPQDMVIILVAILASLGFWWIVRRLWPPERRRVHNEITGWQVSVLGTTYAVIIGFMLFAVWSDFKAAEQNAEEESSCLINLFWAASGLPQGQCEEIRKEAANYAYATSEPDYSPRSALGGVDGRRNHHHHVLVSFRV